MVSGRLKPTCLVNVGRLVCCSFFMPRLCDAAVLLIPTHMSSTRCFGVLLFVWMNLSGIITYFFRLPLQKCQKCLNYWLRHGADLRRGTASHPDWIALEWARASNASPESLRWLTPSVRRAFCAGVELDMSVHVPGRIHRREVSQMSLRSRDHHLFLHAAGNLYKVCVQAWLDRGADTSYGAPWEPHKSAFTWTEEAQGYEDLLSMLSAPGGERCLFDQQPSYCFSVPEVAAQRGDIVSFSDFWSLGADDQGRGAAVASAALRGDLAMLKDICCYNGHKNLVSELLKVGAPDESSP